MDVNRIQNDDFVENVLPMGTRAPKVGAFGWHVIEIDGHDMAAGRLGPGSGARAVQGPADDDRRQHGQGQGRLLYGKQPRLARQGAQRRAGRAGAGRDQFAPMEVEA